jgi:selenocysteine lyase/cysteine desulfurase
LDKRNFLKQLGQAAMISPFLPYTLGARDHDPEARTLMSAPEDIWDRVRTDYSLKPDYINLENGYYCIAPKPVLEKFIEHVRQINYEGSYYMRTVQTENKKKLAGRLAALLGCAAEEVIITRNTTESLDLIIGGYPWEAGDEAIMAEQDYGAMLDQFDMVSRRFGTVNRIVSVPNHPLSDEALVSLYEAQITPRTKLMMVCHMINITGQILPVRKLCDMAHRHGVEVMVDGAHCVGHIEVNIPQLHCDYYGTSLHKWLSAPLGCGLLYVAPDRVAKIWPLLSERGIPATDIMRLNHTGTHPVHTDLAIASALDYLEYVGLERKQERLRFLQRYWSEPLRGVPKIVVNTPSEISRSCGIGNVGITHMAPADLAKTLLDEFRIFTVAIDGANVHGCRITPNIYTTTAELDQFIAAMKELASRG